MPAKPLKKTYGGWLFLGIVLLAYLILSLASPGKAVNTFVFFTQVMRQVLPMLALAFLLLFIANLVLQPKRVRHFLGKGSGIKGWILAVFAGIFSVGSIYAWYAILSELQQKGMRNALIAVFLYSRAIKLPLLPLMIHYFGAVYTLVLCFYLVCFSIISGIIMDKLNLQQNG